MDDPRIGLDFGDYRVTRKLAEGGMGAVYLAEHPSGMRKVVKFMLGEALKIPAIRKRFENECLAAKRLKGRSGIVEIDSFGERNGEMYLVMEYIDGVTLEQHIARNVRLTEHHTAHIIFLILRALAVLHKEGIIHRDLKPSNVFLRDTDERPWDPTLIDFGIVHDKQAMTTAEFGTREGQMIGTPGFMATEQYGQANKVTPATDIFACAVMTWLMLTGELPWGIAENEYAQYDRQLNHVPVWPAHIPLTYAEGWKQILINALAPDPARRPQTAQTFALLLAQALHPIPPHVPNGLGMLEKLAPKFLADLPPELETVRHPDGRIEVASFWSPRTPGAVLGASSSLDFNAIRVSAVMAVPHASAPTISARPHVSTPATTPITPAGSVSPMTTLSGASGQARSISGARLAALGLGTALAIGAAIAGVAFGINRSGSHSSGTSGDAVDPAATKSGSQLPSPGVAAETPPSSPPRAVVDTPMPTTTVTANGSAGAGSVAPPAPTNSAAHVAPASDTTTAKPASTASSPTTDTRTGSTSSRPKKHSKPAGTSTAKQSADKPTDQSSTTTVAPNAGSGARTGSGKFDPDAIKE